MNLLNICEVSLKNKKTSYNIRLAKCRVKAKIESLGFLFLKTILFNMFLNVNLDQNNFKAQRP